MSTTGPGEGGTQPPQGLDHAEALERIAPAALLAALEAIAAPAYLVKAPGTVLHANRRGRALLATDRDRVTVALAATPGPRGPAVFPVEGRPDHRLVVLPDLESDARAKVAVVAQRWGLTPRQTAVLALVAQGESNRSVATKLGCSEKTVELHVSALLAKTQCSSRSQLVASFWTDPG